MTWRDFFILTIPEAAVGELRIGVERMSRMPLPSADGACQQLTLPLSTSFSSLPHLGMRNRGLSC